MINTSFHIFSTFSISSSMILCVCTAIIGMQGGQISCTSFNWGTQERRTMHNGHTILILQHAAFNPSCIMYVHNHIDAHWMGGGQFWWISYYLCISIHFLKCGSFYDAVSYPGKKRKYVQRLYMNYIGWSLEVIHVNIEL